MTAVRTPHCTPNITSPRLPNANADGIMPYLLLTGSGIQIPMKRGRNARDEKREARSGLWVLLYVEIESSKSWDQGQAVWSRRWPVEITCCARRNRGKAGERDDAGYGSTAGVAKKSGFPGILSLDAQVRIGPLRQSACQSVRMGFLAVAPGVHSIDALTLTDVESAFSLNLRRNVWSNGSHDPFNVTGSLVRNLRSMVLAI